MRCCFAALGLPLDLEIGKRSSTSTTSLDSLSFVGLQGYVLYGYTSTRCLYLVDRSWYLVPIVGNFLFSMLRTLQKSPNDKSGLGLNSNVKNKSTIKLKHKGNNKNSQDQVKNPANIVCFKCKEEGHHVRSCPLKKKPLSVKQQGKRSQAPPQVINATLPKRTTQALPRVVTSSKKKAG